MADYLNESKYEHTSYLESLIRVGNLRETVNACVRALSKHNFDAIAFRGLSGTLVAPAVALAMGKELIAVRKPCEFEGSDNTHSCHHVEGYKASKRYIILDDIICSGNTARKIIAAVKEFAPLAQFVGLLEANYAGRSANSDGSVPCPLYVLEPGNKTYSGFMKVDFTNHVIPRPKFPKPKKEEPLPQAESKRVTNPFIPRIPKPVFVAQPVPPEVTFKMIPAGADDVVAEQNVNFDYKACEMRVLSALSDLEVLRKKDF